MLSQKLRVYGAVLISLVVVVVVALLTRPEPLPTEGPTDERSEVSEVVATTPATSTVAIIGTSTNGLPIFAYTFGTGTTPLLFVGGVHGGYEWNTIALAYEMIDAFRDGTLLVPTHQTVHIIPSLNPDGAELVVGTSERFAPTAVKTVPAGVGRFNANNVDLNRNFDCKWQATSTWRGQPVSAGSAPFSEVEARVLRDYVLALEPVAVVTWHSQARAVYGSECEAGILATTTRMLEAYAEAASYTPIPLFTAYPITGDLEGWLAKRGIPAITVELETRTSTEWERNKAGVAAIMGLW